MRFDVTFKQMFRDSKGILSRMLFGEVVEWPNVELPEVRNLRVDLLARCADGSLRQVEVQVRNDAGMGFRMLEYSVALKRAYGMDVEQTVLYAGREPLRMSGVYRAGRTRHEFEVLDLRGMDGELLLGSDDWADNELALLTKVDPEKVIGVVFGKLRGMRVEDKERAIFTFAVLGGIIGMDQLIKQRYEEMTIDLMENAIFAPIIQKKLEEGLEAGKALGMLQGIEQGIAQGMAQGAAQERRELLRELLRAKFGELPEWALDKVSKAGPEAQRDWAIGCMRANSLEELLG